MQTVTATVAEWPVLAERAAAVAAENRPGVTVVINSKKLTVTVSVEAVW